MQPDTYTRISDALGRLDDLWIKFRRASLLQEGNLMPMLTSSYYMVIPKCGESRLTLDLHTYPLQQDAVYIAGPGQTIAIREEEGAKSQLYVLEFDIHPSGADGPAFPLLGELPIHPDPALIRMCEGLCGSTRSGQAVERLYGQAVFHELLFWTLTHHREELRVDSRTALEKTKAYIDTNYEENLTMDQLARMADISPKYYGSLFKKTFGKTVTDYMTEVRINRAKQLMAQSRLRLRDVAFMVGYQDEFYFSRMFKREVGVPPTVYLKSRRQKIAAYSAPILGQLLALGVLPYAAPLHPKWTSYYYDNYRADIPLHLSGFRFNEDWESNVGRLAQSEVDCIITTDRLHGEEKERLERIAPVHFIPEEAPWREQLQQIAGIVGAADEAQTWLDRYDAEARLVREKLHRQLQGEKVLIASLFKKAFRLFPVRGMREVVCHDMRLLTPHEADGYSPGQTLSLTELSAMDADHILLNVCQETETLQYWEELQSDVDWTNMKAVRRRRVQLISSDPWREYSAHAKERMIRDLCSRLCGNRT
ncbi:AraC family transcriptional regulator [Paenibacillus mucilaginosus K02]|uniref:AraC family transcriptional regulator n=2 Tax=Paenibacillus mucilaginosus TaxID=61624 RepID=I0BLC1_9BACL|nr:AraC family transcriptional regulator [Paenibacillus mucilaginosus K02]